MLAIGGSEKRRDPTGRLAAGSDQLATGDFRFRALPLRQGLDELLLQQQPLLEHPVFTHQLRADGHCHQHQQDQPGSAVHGRIVLVIAQQARFGTRIHLLRFFRAAANAGHAELAVL